MRFLKFVVCLLIIIIPLLAFTYDYEKQGNITDIKNARLIATYPSPFKNINKDINLPFTYPLKNSSLTRVKYEIIVPSINHDNQAVYSILFPQILHGGNFYLNGNLVSSLPASNNTIRYTWYEPYMISLPASLLNQNKINHIQIEQSAYQRNFIIPAIYFGSQASIEKEFHTINFLNKVLSTATNIVCWSAGLFLLGIWFSAKREKTYGLAGTVTVLWSTLFTLALINVLPMHLWIYWRAALYLSTGLLVTLMTLLVISFCKIEVPSSFKNFIWAWTITGPTCFMIFGQSLEQWLDIYWTGVLISFYLFAILALIITCIRKPTPILIALLVQSNISFVLAIHDYGAQAGFLTKYAKNLSEYGIPEFLLQPIYLTHLGLPLLLVIVGFILVKEYAQNVIAIKNSNLTLQSELEKRTEELNIANQERNRIEIHNAATEERQKIFQDIHDGLGSKLLLALITLRSQEPKSPKVEEEISNCLDELRFIVNNDGLEYKDICEYVRDICIKQTLHFEYSDINFKFRVSNCRRTNFNTYQKINIIRIIQECFSNILKHSKATHAQLIMREINGSMFLIVQDNGIGFRLTPISEAQTTRGVLGIKKRLNDIGGRYKLHSALQGTRWVFIIKSTELAKGLPISTNPSLVL
jgi:signal transduction histidine kinase